MSTSLSCAIVGLPNVGKSTLFTAITKKQVDAANYPFCTIDPNIGIVELLDSRLDKLSEISKSKKIVNATVSFVDVAGLVKGASTGEGLGNQFLSNIRQTDAIIHVVRCFEDDEVVHVSGKIDPIEDIETINLELILADLQAAENIEKKITKKLRGKKEISEELQLIKKIINHLNQNLAIRILDLSEEERILLKNFDFLTSKKMLYVANIAEDDLTNIEENKYVKLVKDFGEKQQNKTIVICAQLEQEIAQLDDQEAKDFLIEVGLKESGLNLLTKTAFNILHLITYLTTGEIETRAWTIKKGSSAATAAGKIHTDIEKGFIRAEVISYNDIVQYNGRVAAKEAGKARFEGRDYIVQDGDVILFYHN